MKAWRVTIRGWERDEYGAPMFAIRHGPTAGKVRAAYWASLRDVLSITLMDMRVVRASDCDGPPSYGKVAP